MIRCSTEYEFRRLFPPKRAPGGSAGSHSTDCVILCHAGPLRFRGQARHSAEGASWFRAIGTAQHVDIRSSTPSISLMSNLPAHWALGFVCFGIALSAPSLPSRSPFSNKMLYAVMALFAISRPSVLLVGGFLAVGAVEVFCSVSMSPITSLIDSAVRHSFGGKG